MTAGVSNGSLLDLRLAVFDLAGTTVVDDGAVLHCPVETAAAYDLPGEPAELNSLMGLKKRDVFELLARLFAYRHAAGHGRPTCPGHSAPVVTNSSHAGNSDATIGPYAESVATAASELGEVR